MVLRISISLLVICQLSLGLLAQGVVISPINTQPDSSAILDLVDSTRGFLPPRLTTQQRTAILNPALGLTIFNTDIRCLEFYRGPIDGWYSPCPVLPQISTDSVNSVFGTIATGHANLIQIGNQPIVSQGICWSTQANPSILNDTAGVSPGIGSFQVSMKNLNFNTLYHYRAFVETFNGIVYGAIDTFRTSPGFVVQFTSVGNHQWQVPQGLNAIELLVVAGGGGGGNGQSSCWEGGGGGAGGLIYQSQFPVIPGNSISVVVGAGGSANNNGQNSQFHNIVAFGGGAGRSCSNGLSGGSGGGGGHPGTAGGSGQPGQGNAGGNGGSSCGGGGGGAGASGNSGPSGGKGGDGLAFSITGVSQFYAGGGGGFLSSCNPPSPGGLGGGGNGTCVLGGTGGAGQANTGGGGGACQGSPCSGGAGGSGVVILRY
jgi:hypothetical protein